MQVRTVLSTSCPRIPSLKPEISPGRGRDTCERLWRSWQRRPDGFRAMTVSCPISFLFWLEPQYSDEWQPDCSAAACQFLYFLQRTSISCWTSQCVSHLS